MHITSPPNRYEYEVDFRLGLLQSALLNMKLLKKLFIADCRDGDSKENNRHGSISRMRGLLEEIVWGEGTKHLDTFEILIERDLAFFTSLLVEEKTSDEQTTLNLPSGSRRRRKPCIKNFTIKVAYPTNSYNSSIASFEYQLAYLLLVLSPSLTHLTLISLPKPQYLPYPFDVGTGRWGGSVGKVFEILGPRALRFLEHLTIEGADTRYEVAEDAIVSWITERSIFVKPLTDEELRQMGLKAQERMIQQTHELSTAIVPCPLSKQLHWKLFERYHYEDYLAEGEPHLNCDQSCNIHGSTSGRFVLPGRDVNLLPHSNLLLRKRAPPRRFQHLHLINCSEPWPAFYTIGCLHPPSTLHFSSPWMDSSSTDVPDSLRALGADKNRFAVSQELRKAYGAAPVFPAFNHTFFATGFDVATRPWARTPSTNRLHCRRIRKKLENYMGMLEATSVEQISTLPMSLSQVMASRIKRIEFRTLERVSMKLLQTIVEWYGENVEVLGISRLDGSYNESSAKGQVRSWGKIFGRCKKLKELRIVWNLFDDMDWQAENETKIRMKFGIGERRLAGKEVLVQFSEEEWWDSTRTTLNIEKDITEFESSPPDGGNGEGPSTQPPPRSGLLPSASSLPLDVAPTITADKSSTVKEEDAKTTYSTLTQEKESTPVRWIEAWYRWPMIKRYFPISASSSSYVTRDGERYLTPRNWQGTGGKIPHSTDWHREQMKEILMFLIDWKYRKIRLAQWQQQVQGQRQAMAQRQQQARQQMIQQRQQQAIIMHRQQQALIANTLLSQLTPTTKSTGSMNQDLEPSHSLLPWKGTQDKLFCITTNPKPTYTKVSPISNYDSLYPFYSIDWHNARVFFDRLKEEYRTQEELLARTIWDAIDRLSEGSIDRNKWEDCFLVKSFTVLQRTHGAFPVRKGIIFTSQDYNEYEGDLGDDCQMEKRLGPWEIALKELLNEEPAVFNVPALRAADHQCITRKLSDFFQQINMWHRQRRLCSTLGSGVQRFCALCWVMFEEVVTLETVVGLLENGREVTAHPVRRHVGSTTFVELVKIRCWSCGGGWAGDYNKGTRAHGKVPIRIKVGSRECKCQF